MKLRITAAAEAELIDIGAFIAEDNPSRAESFVGELLERCFGLAEHSKGHPVVAVRLGREIRRCPYGAYLIFYSIVNDVLEINHIIHGARDHMRLLFSDD